MRSGVRRTGRWLTMIPALAGFACLAACTQPLRQGRSAEVLAHPEPLAALRSPDPQLESNKQLVFDMWRGVVNAGQVELADTLLAEGYVQHSPVLRTGRRAFKEIFSVVPRRPIPEVVAPPLVSMVAEGNLVVMALRETIPARDGHPSYVSTHFNLFRVEEGRLQEHWHSVQTPPGPDVPLPEVGGPQPVTGATSPAQQTAWLGSSSAELAANKRLVFDMWRRVIDAGRKDEAVRYFEAGFADYSALAGLAGSWFGSHPLRDSVAATLRSPVVAIVAEADRVVLVTQREYPHPVHAGRTYTTTWFDMFSIRNGRIHAHWDAALRSPEPRR